MSNDLNSLADHVELLDKRERCADDQLSRMFSSGGIVRPYTECVNAALDLVPREMCPGVSQNVHTGMWHAWVGHIVNDEPVVFGQADGFTAPTALVAAALRAHVCFDAYTAGDEIDI